MIRDLRAFLGFWIMDSRDRESITADMNTAARIRDENTARLVLRPSKTRLEFTSESGRLCAVVILKHVERTMYGTSALFLDPIHFVPVSRNEIGE